MTFQCDSGVISDPESEPGRWYMVWSPFLSNNQQSSIPEHDSRDRQTEIGNPETEKRVHRIHGTLETRLQMILRSPVAPQGTPADTNITKPGSLTSVECYEPLSHTLPRPPLLDHLCERRCRPSPRAIENQSGYRMDLRTLCARAAVRTLGARAGRITAT